MSKLINSAVRINNYIHLFQCPICSSSVSVDELKSIVCSNKHTFDLARQGYANLLTKHIQTNYNRDLFEARREVIVQSDFFDPFHRDITKIINNFTVEKGKLTIADMGTGEGSHLHYICDTLQTQTNKDVLGIGIDIAKDGVLIAARNYDNIIWFVADLAKTPINDRKVNVITSILSPSNYEEFNRLLEDDGIVIKVVPGKHHLKELRKFFHNESEQQAYSNKKVVNHFKNNFDVIATERIRNTAHFSPAILKSLIKMTPLTWEAKKNQVKEFLAKGAFEVTADLDIIIGRKNMEV